MKHRQRSTVRGRRPHNNGVCQLAEECHADGRSLIRFHAAGSYVFAGRRILLSEDDVRRKCV